MEKGGTGNSSSKKKRKICHSGDDLALFKDTDNHDDVVKEEEKMEQFFSLIRSFRETRDHIRNGSSAEFIKDFQVDKTKKQKIDVAVWNPSFQPEDFSQDHKEEDLKQGLDLNLSL